MMEDWGFWKKTALGIPAAMFILVLVGLISGNLDGVAAFLYIVGFTLICTGGLALIVYIPLLFVLGCIAAEFIKVFKTFREESGYQNPYSRAKLANEMKAARRYILKARSWGYTDEKILNTLRSAGWSEETIKKTLPTM